MTDVTQRFSGRAIAYAAYRPRWPRELITGLLDGFAQPDVADIGAGTGLSAQALAAAGACVFAVEPNADMRAQMPSGVHTVDGSAEATSLQNVSIDVVTAFQAYHWFDPPLFFAEAARILRPHGRIAAVWYHRNVEAPFAAAYEAAIARHGERVTELDRNRRSSGVEEALRDRQYRTRILRATTTVQLTWDALTGFMRSCSYLPTSGPGYDRMLEEVRPLYDRAEASGDAEFVWEYVAYLGDR